MKSPPGVSRGERVGFTRSAARRIANAVMAFEGGFRRQPPVYTGRAGDDSEAVLCKTTASWSKGSSATLQIWAGQPGSETNTGCTLTAYNRVGTFKAGAFVTVHLNRHGYYYAAGGGGTVLLGKTSADWAKNSSMSIAVYGGAPGSETATGESVTAYNRFGKVLSGKWVMIGQTSEGEYYLVAPEADQVELVSSAEIVSTTVSGVTTSKLVFHRQKVWVHTVETGTDVEIGLTECVPTYNG